MQTIEYSLNEINKAAKYLIDNYHQVKVWLFKGEMGSGKTTLIKNICSNLGVQETVNSPTFNIVNEYIGKEGMVIYHFDLYRITDIKELDRLGFEEYLRQGDLCLIEWGDKFGYHYTEETLSIKIDRKDNQVRILEILS